MRDTDRYEPKLLRGSADSGWRRVHTAQQVWMLHLPIQMQSVMMLAMRGHDGLPKETPGKHVLRAYRGTVLNAAKYGRPLRWDLSNNIPEGDSFMSLRDLVVEQSWNGVVGDFTADLDQLALHFVMHLMHGAEIVGYKHPDVRFRQRWHLFYVACVGALHLRAEEEETLDRRLSDWDRRHWSDDDPVLGAEANLRAQGVPT